MLTYRKNWNETGPATRPANSRQAGMPPVVLPNGALHPEPPVHAPAPGDIVYGARAVANFIFGDDGDQARRRVFHLASHYRARKEAAGFFKLKGALCLSKTAWRKFHGWA